MNLVHGRAAPRKGLAIAQDSRCARICTCLTQPWWKTDMNLVHYIRCVAAGRAHLCRRTKFARYNCSEKLRNRQSSPHKKMTPRTERKRDQQRAKGAEFCHTCDDNKQQKPGKTAVETGLQTIEQTLSPQARMLSPNAGGDYGKQKEHDWHGRATSLLDFKLRPPTTAGQWVRMLLRTGSTWRPPR